MYVFNVLMVFCLFDMCVKFKWNLLRSVFIILILMLLFFVRRIWVFFSVMCCWVVLDSGILIFVVIVNVILKEKVEFCFNLFLSVSEEFISLSRLLLMLSFRFVLLYFFVMEFLVCVKGVNSFIWFFFEILILLFFI